MTRKREKLGNETLEQSDNSEAQQKLELTEVRLRAMEELDVYGLVDTNKMSLVLDVILPPKFKVPYFEKYNETKCSLIHLYMFYRK